MSLRKILRTSKIYQKLIQKIFPLIIYQWIKNVEYNEFSQRVFRYDVRFEADLSENEEVAKYCRISRDTWAIFIRDANNKLAKEAALDIYKARIDRLSKKYDFIASNWVIDIDSNVSPQGWFRFTFTLQPLNISAFKS